MAKNTISSELQYREAFIRLKENKPKILPKGSKVTQNNVSKEAGSTSTAMRKDRYPDLIREIQEFINQTPKVESAQKKLEKLRLQNRDLKAQTKIIGEIDNYETSKVLTLLVEIAKLNKKVLDLEKALNRNTITYMK